MTLTDQTQLIHDLTRENPDTTIRDYLDVVKEMEGIEETTLSKMFVECDRNKVASALLLNSL